MTDTRVGDFEIVPGREGSSEVLHLRGEVDLATAPVLKACFDELLDRGALTIIVDARELQFIDTSGLSVLATSVVRAHGARVETVLRSASPSLRRTLEITGLETLIRLC